MVPIVNLSTVENILKGSLDLIQSPSPSVKIQIKGGKVCLGLTTPSNVLPLHPKQIFPLLI